jgi:hypothetical protein
VILFNLSGHGHFDLSAYEKYLTGSLEDYQIEDQSPKEIREHLPMVQEPANT